ncbi:MULTISPECIES: benzaldehyde dehydrogenase [Marinomonas]|uniref:Benzaldehyde dehydrogenase n=1 Tax=Marinomonas arctica TaxID=383750 RepID=A0A7H1J7N1_9GAMM|nr:MULTISPECIES: benzaldehyde dehydrogenase [Marinomonas]MCS7487484.1 benzaldehyde dehydrogenase [Marinomonas sp. BSi20414]QNT06497.1 benzaldehyde dehydrogenase [Marinomonas arctica]GGN35574.1 aldehyde dehydrogenase [Marinomonas arctica]
MTISVLESKKWSGKFFTGDWVATSNKQDVMEPATGKVLSEVGIATADDVYLACQQAAKAQKEWLNVPPRDKAALFHKAAAFMQDNFDELALYVARETGGIIPKGQHEIKEAIVILQLAANMTLEPNGLTLPSVPERMSYATRKPIGVIGVISPFNFPLILSIRSIAPALATGNAVVTKPDPQTPVTGGFILALALEAAGFPKGLYQVLPGAVEAGEALCNAPEIGMVAFTGSTAAGRKVGEACGRNLKKVSLELGGKSSLIILEDADLDVAASNIAWGAYFHQGQICMASGRILVQESIAEALTAKIVEKAQHLPVGDPVSGTVALGPLINARQLEKVHSIVQDSVAAGAKLEAGGTYEGPFYAPTVLSNVKPGMRSFDEEIFGPVVNIVTFESDAEAVEMANNTQYGLAGAVISNDLSRAQRIGAQLHVGLLHINDQTVNDECINPFGGCGASGNGSAVCGPASWDLYTHWQWVTVKPSATPYPF